MAKHHLLESSYLQKMEIHLGQLFKETAKENNQEMLYKNAQLYSKVQVQTCNYVPKQSWSEELEALRN